MGLTVRRMTPAEQPTTDPTSRRPSWLTRNLLAVSVVSFLQDTASDMLYPILPIFLTVTLGAPAALVGIVEGVAEAVAALTKVRAGRWADRHRRKPLIGAGYGLAAAGKVIVAAAGAWPVVLAGRCLDRFGKGMRGAPRDALMVEGIPREARGRAFGFHRSMDTAGAFVGPLVGLLLYRALGHDIRPLLWIAVVPGVLSAIAVLAVREHHEVPASAADAVAPTGAVGTSAVDAPLPRAYRRVVAVLVAANLVNVPDTLVLLRASQLGLSVSQVILAYVLFNAAATVLAYPAGALADRLGPARVYALGLATFAVCYVGLGLTTTAAMVWPLLIVYGGFNALTDGVGKAWISSIVPAAQQGRAQGTYQGAMGGAVLLAGIWGGLTWGGSGRFTLTAAGLVAAALAVALPVVARSEA